jgi:hypothetical protein
MMHNPRPEILKANLPYAAKASLYRMPGYRAQRHEFDLAWLMGFQNLIFASFANEDDGFKTRIHEAQKAFAQSLMEYGVRNAELIMQAYVAGRKDAMRMLKQSPVETIASDISELNTKLAHWARDLELKMTGNRRKVYDKLRKDNVEGP